MRPRASLFFGSVAPPPPLRIVGYGDSISISPEVDEGCLAVAQSLLPGSVTSISEAVAGHTLDDCLTGFATDVLPQMSTTPGTRNVYVFQCSTNNLGSGVTEEQALEIFTSLYLPNLALATAAGFDDIVACLLETQGPDQIDPSITTYYNGLIVAGASGNGYRVATGCQSAQIGNAGAPLNSDLYVDAGSSGRHYTAAGQMIVGALLAATILAPYRSPRIGGLSRYTASIAGGTTIIVSGGRLAGARGWTVAGMPVASATPNSDGTWTLVTAACPFAGAGPVTCVTDLGAAIGPVVTVS